MKVINAAGLPRIEGSARSERVAVIFNPDTSPQSKLFLPVIKASASAFAVEVFAPPVHDVADISLLLRADEIIE